MRASRRDSKARSQRTSRRCSRGDRYVGQSCARCSRCASARSRSPLRAAAARRQRSARLPILRSRPGSSSCPTSPSCAVMRWWRISTGSACLPGYRRIRGRPRRRLAPGCAFGRQAAPVEDDVRPRARGRLDVRLRRLPPGRGRGRSWIVRAFGDRIGAFTTRVQAARRVVRPWLRRRDRRGHLGGPAGAGVTQPRRSISRAGDGRVDVGARSLRPIAHGVARRSTRVRGARRGARPDHRVIVLDAGLVRPPSGIPPDSSA